MPEPATLPLPPVIPAQVLHALGDMRYEAVPRPEPEPGQVLDR